MIDYLNTVKVTESELEHAGALFDTSVRQLALHLVPAITADLQSKQAADLSDAWMIDAMACCQLLSEDRSRWRKIGDAEAMWEESRELTSALAGGFDSIHPQHLDAEAHSCARELAHRVLSRWYQLLSAAVPDTSGVRLNANLLPGMGEVNDIVSHASGEAYAVDDTVIVASLRSYWEHLFGQAQVDAAPVELGPHLWIVADVLSDLKTYRLFDSRDAARNWGMAQTVRPAASDSVERVLDWDYLATLALYRIQDKIKHRPMRAVRSAMENCFGPRPAQVRSRLSAGPDYGVVVSQRSPQFVFVECLERGVDAVSSVLGLPQSDAIAHMRSADKALRDHLKHYAKLHGMSRSAVNSVFAGSVATAILAIHDYPAWRADDDVEEAGDITEVQPREPPLAALQRSFADVLNLPNRLAHQLALNTVAGMERTI